MNKKSVTDVDVNGKRVLVRCDFNVPMKDGKITGQLFRSPDLTEQDIIAKMI